MRRPPPTLCRWSQGLCTTHTARTQTGPHRPCVGGAKACALLTRREPSFAVFARQRPLLGWRRGLPWRRQSLADWLHRRVRRRPAVPGRITRVRAQLPQVEQALAPPTQGRWGPAGVLTAGVVQKPWLHRRKVGGGHGHRHRACLGGAVLLDRDDHHQGGPAQPRRVLRFGRSGNSLLPIDLRSACGRKERCSAQRQFPRRGKATGHFAGTTGRVLRTKAACPVLSAARVSWLPVANMLH